MPELQAWLPAVKVDAEQPVYPYTKTWDEAKDDPCLIVHTSGSTGVPKVVTYTNDMLVSIDRHRRLLPVEGCRCLVWETTGRRLYSTIPIFHVSVLLQSRTAYTRIDASRSSELAAPCSSPSSTTQSAS